MDFTIPEDLELIRSSVREMVQKELLPLENTILSKPELEPTEKAHIEKLVKEMGLWAANVPEEFGGGGLSALGGVLIKEELAKTFIPVEIGDVSPILYECSQTQRQKYLDPVVAGQKHYAIAYQEPAQFTSPNAMRTIAVPREKEFIISGDKLLNRSDFDFLILFAKVKDKGITGFLVNKEGLQPNGRRVNFENFKISQDSVLGEIGKGLLLGKKWYPKFRILQSGELLGTSERLLEIGITYARDGQILGQGIKERKNVITYLASMVSEIAALRWLIYHSAWLYDNQKTQESDLLVTSLYASEVLTRTIERCIEIYGGTFPLPENWQNRFRPETEQLDFLRQAIAQNLLKT